MKREPLVPYARVKPYLVELMQILRLDQEYISAEGDVLINGDNKEILDLIGGYGACLLGHNNPQITGYARSLLDNRTPIHAQMSLRNASGRLAMALDAEAKAITGKHYISTFANSGAEAVEAAIKIALYRFRSKINAFIKQVENDITILNGIDPDNLKLPVEWQCNSIAELVFEIISTNEKRIGAIQPKMIGLVKGFHGKTTGALNLTENEKFKKPFMGNQLRNIFIEPQDYLKLAELIDNESFKLHRLVLIEDRIEVVSKKFSAVTSVFVEPVQGEGGVHVIPEQTLQYIRDVSATYDILLVLDEIQCGFYRTGHFFTTGIPGDIHLLGKQLGGGLAKISVMMVESSVYPPEFGALHTSTFAEDEFSSKISGYALELSKKIAPDVIRKGRLILDKLRLLAAKYPEVIKEVRGKGLLIGIEFRDHSLSQNYTLQFIFRTGYFNYMVCSYLLNNHNVRVASSLSSSTVIRIEPSAYISGTQIDRLLFALEDFCQVLDRQDNYFFIRHLLADPHVTLRSEPMRFSKSDVPLSNANDRVKKVGFITHFISPETVKAADPSLAGLNDDAIHGLLDKLMVVGKPIIAGSQIIQSLNGSFVELFIAGCCFTSKMAKDAMSRQQTGPYIEMVQNALDMLVNEYGVTYTGLGQYTSILTHNGKLLQSPSAFVTTGNSFTTFLGIEALLQRCEDNGINVSEEKLAVIGAAGNIASVFADCFSAYTKNLVLLGSGNQSFDKLHQVVDRIVSNSFERYRNDVARGELDAFLHLTRTFRNFRDQNCDIRFLVKALKKEIGLDFPIKTGQSLDGINDCKIVVAATNASAPFLKPEHFADGTIVCDIAVPMNSTKDLLENDKGIQVIQGGLARLPQNEEILVKGFPLPAGVIFGCLAETLISGYSDVEMNYSLGQISPDRVNKIGQLGSNVGITFNELKNVSAL